MTTPNRTFRATPNRSCNYCGRSYYARPAVLRAGMGRFCSKSCSNRASNPALSKRVPSEVEAQIVAAYRAGKSKREAGLAFGYGRGGVDKVLKRHGVAARSLSEATKGRVFTPEHRAAIARAHHDVSGRNNPMFGKPPGHARWVHVEHLGRRVRSTWEAAIAEALRALGIRHEYESRRIDLGDCTYLPDFYLPDLDVHIEVKGWMNDRARRVLPRLAVERPDVRLVVIDQWDYRAIRAEPRALLALLPPWGGSTTMG